MERLTYDDDLFLRMECVLGVPVVNQIVWKFGDLVSPLDLKAMWTNLAAGPIARSVRRSSVPGARDGWIAAHSGADPVTIGEPIHSADIDTWIEGQAHIALDPMRGPAWRLSATAVAERGSVVSLVASHVVGDGGALTSAAAAAIRGAEDPADFVAVSPDSDGGGVLADVGDSAGRVAAAASGVARALLSMAKNRASKERTTAAPARWPVAAAPHPYALVAIDGPITPSTVIVDCPTREWSAAATARGGSSNTLLVGLVLGILTASGRVGAEDAVKVSLPVSTRILGDRRANATSGVSMIVDGGAGYYDDLRAIRAGSKKAFSALADTSAPSNFELTKPLMQLLPDAVVRRAAASATAPLCLCSNLGDRGSAVKTIGSSTATSVAMRSITQNTSVELLRRTKGGISAWWNESGETSTLCVTGLDPDRFPSKDGLRGLVAAEFAKWGLTPTFW